jgi:uncharacterized iron-regulated protein
MTIKIITKTMSTMAVTLALMTGCSATQESNSPPNNKPASQTELATLYDFYLIDSETKQPISIQQLAKKLNQTDVIFIGELHSHQASHLLQMQLLNALYQQDNKISLSMEQFTRDAQEVVSKYVNNEYGESTLIDKGNAWDNYKGSYRPLVEFAREHQLDVIAANSPAMHVRCVGREGIDVLQRLDDKEKQFSATDIDLENKDYQQKFYEFLESAGSSHGQTNEQMKARMRNIFAAQLLRDATMAESIAKQMQLKPDGKVIHINGTFHSDNGLGTVAELKRRMPELTIAIISPEMKTADGELDFEKGNYLYVIKSLPDRFKDKELEAESTRKLIGQRMKEKCEI